MALASVGPRVPPWAFEVALGLALACAALGVQVRWSPANSEIHVDGTVFAYGGARIREGEIPYRDFWDHKPPLVFYLNALAFWLWGVDAWSLWYLMVLWTAALAIVNYAFLRQVTERGWAVLGTAVLLGMVVQRRFFEEPNLTEFYALLPTALALWFTNRYLRRACSGALVGLGAAIAGTLLLKQSTAGTALACAFIVACREVRRGVGGALRRMWLIAILPVLAGLAILVYWGLQQALVDFWEANVVYNRLAHLGKWTPVQVYAVVRGLAAYGTSGPLLLLALGGAIDLWRRWPRGSRGLPAMEAFGGPSDADRWTWLACFLGLGLQVFTVSLVVPVFDHDYMSVLPALCASSAYWLPSRRETRGSAVQERGLSLRGLSSLAAAAFSVWFLVSFGETRPTLDHLRSFALDAPVRRPLRTNVGKYIMSVTDPEDTVLWWGIGAELNFETGRRAPSRYFYYHPLFQPGFGNRERWQEFLADLEANRPVLIVAPWGWGYAPAFGPPLEDLASRCGCTGDILEGFKAFAEYVAANYERQLMFEDSFAFYWRRTP